MQKHLQKQWKSLLQKPTLDLTKQGNDDDIEIVVIDKPKLIAERKQDALDFWLRRVKSKNSAIQIEDDKDSKPAIQQAKLAVQQQKASVPIVSHQKQRERSGKDVRDGVVRTESSAKSNVEKYKQSLFKSGEDKKAPKPTTAESQQLAKKRRFEHQLQIIESLNQPRWKQEKEKRHQLNKDKYPISSSYVEYDYSRTISTSKEAKKFNQATWAEYERSQEVIRMKKREKQRQEREREKEEKRRLQNEKRIQQEESYSRILSGMCGLQPVKKIKLDEFVPTPPVHPPNPITTQAQVEAEKEREEIKEIIGEQGEQGEQGEIQQSIAISNDNQQSSSMEIVAKRHGRYGLGDIVKPYESRAPQFIKIILAHNYGVEFNLPENKKIPDYFEDQKIYSKVFHYLITNQCIADVSRRLQLLSRSNKDPIRVVLTNLKQNEDQCEVYLQEEGATQEKISLKSLALSKYRLGVITTSKSYHSQAYAINPQRDQFAQVVMLVTPESKQELRWVKAVGTFKCHELQMIMRRRKSKELYFHDLQKLSTHVREYVAVSNIEHSELAHIIFEPKILDKEMNSYVPHKDCLNPILEHLQGIFNPTQWQSIREMALRERGIVLLQGPPGTGKTSTLMGLLSAQYEYLKKTGDNRKIMICAPSNAAVDHIARRLSTEGLFNGEGQIIKPVILRTGIVQTLDPVVRAVSLDELCEKKMLMEEQLQSLTTPQIKERIIEIQKELRQLRGSNEKDYSLKKQEEVRYEQMLFTFRTKKVVTSRKYYSQIESQFLKEAEIILTTLSSSGNEKLDRLRGDIACLVVDEAAQATQTNLLIALQSGVEKVLLIGDPYQLPATCFSPDCNVTLFNRSLFQRFLDADIKPYFLNIQYRMAPMIRYFPSLTFYHDRLIDSDSILARTEPPFLECFKGRNVIFIDIKYGRQTKRNDSYANQAQGKAIGLLVRCLLEPNTTMGVITPYQSQRKTIMTQCYNELRSNAEELKNFQTDVMVNTVDSFQGQEKDIILVSTVRANSRHSLGFLTDERRINVTLTRSKYVLVVVGHGDTLGSNEVWNGFLEWTEKNKVYYEVNSPEDIKGIMKEVFLTHNERAVRRRKYNQLTTDARKQHRMDIQKEDFRPKRSPQKPIRSEAGEKGKEEPSKYALDIRQSQRIVEEKRRKEQETIMFEEMTERMRMMEERALKGKEGDEFYRQVFG